MNIFGFIEGHVDENFVSACAITSDGAYLCRVITKPENAISEIDSMYQVYENMFPRGYIFEWVNEPSSHNGIKRALSHCGQNTF